MSEWRGGTWLVAQTSSSGVFSDKMVQLVRESITVVVIHDSWYSSYAYFFFLPRREDAHCC